MLTSAEQLGWGEAHNTSFYQSNEELAILTSPSYNDEWVIQIASLLAQPGNRFEAFAQIIPAVIWGESTIQLQTIAK